MTSPLHRTGTRAQQNPAPCILPLSPEVAPQLYSLWLDSVRASHTFLTEEHITDIGTEVQAACGAVSLWGIVVAEGDLCATDGAKRIAAFMGISGASIEMLFVHPHFFRKGYGKSLVDYALRSHKVRYVDVNEQNPQAAAFYARMGFKPIGRDALDAQGRPFPILHLQHSSTLRP